MKIWELIAVLSELPAGTDVHVTAYPGGTTNVLTGVTVDDDIVHLNGDGRYTDDLDSARERHEP